MQRINRVHALANLMVYDLEMPDSVRHPVRFFRVSDILNAAGEEAPENLDTEATMPMFRLTPSAAHTPTCNCRFCTTGIFNTRLLKRAP